jgi:hypothetical protein
MFLIYGLHRSSQWRTALELHIIARNNASRRHLYPIYFSLLNNFMQIYTF